MSALRCLVMVLTVGLFSSVGILLARDIVMATRLRWLLARQRSSRLTYRKREDMTLVGPYAKSKQML
jgi:hypothetical protein